MYISHSRTTTPVQTQHITLFCRPVLAPAFTSSETTSVLPFQAAIISAEYPSCVMCSETMMTSRKLALKCNCKTYLSHMICINSSCNQYVNCLQFSSLRSKHQQLTTLDENDTQKLQNRVTLQETKIEHTVKFAIRYNSFGQYTLNLRM